MDYDDILHNFTEVNASHEFMPEEASQHIFFEIFFSLLCAAGIFIDVFIVYVILRYERLRRCADFVILANWVIADIFYLMVTPSGYRMISLIEMFPLSAEFNCMLYEGAQILQSTHSLFALLLLVDWGLCGYWKSLSVIFRRYHIIIISLVWLLTVCLSITAISLCYTEKGMYTLRRGFSVDLLGLTFVVMLLLHIIRKIQKCRKIPSSQPTLMLTMVTINLVVIGFSIFIVLAVEDSALMLLIVGTGLLSTSEINLLALYFLSQDFQACFKQATSCQARYSDDLGNQESETEETVTIAEASGDPNHFRLAFNNDEQELLRTRTDDV